MGAYQERWEGSWSGNMVTTESKVHSNRPRKASIRSSLTYNSALLGWTSTHHRHVTHTPVMSALHRAGALERTAALLSAEEEHVRIVSFGHGSRNPDINQNLQPVILDLSTRILAWARRRDRLQNICLCGLFDTMRAAFLFLTVFLSVCSIRGEWIFVSFFYFISSWDYSVKCLPLI